MLPAYVFALVKAVLLPGLHLELHTLEAPFLFGVWFPFLHRWRKRLGTRKCVICHKEAASQAILGYYNTPPVFMKIC